MNMIILSGLFVIDIYITLFDYFYNSGSYILQHHAYPTLYTYPTLHSYYDDL